MVFCCFSDKPPSEVKTKGPKGEQQQLLLDKQGYPNVFALGLKDAPAAEPLCCLGSCCAAPCGLTACWARKAVLEKYDGGMDKYTCCQGYIGKVCCCDMRETLKCFDGSPAGLCLEGYCCPVFSLSIARIHMMDVKRLQPDPCDWQIIACSNMLQLISCICNILAICISELREAAAIIDCIADLFTLTVAGCMGAQIKHEIDKDANGLVYVQAVAVGQPGQAPGQMGMDPNIPVAQPAAAGAPPKHLL